MADRLVWLTFCGCCDLVAAAIAFDLLFALELFSFSLFVGNEFDGVDFFDCTFGVVLDGFESFDAEPVLLRRPRSGELDDSLSELDEFESESDELADDELEAELEQLESVVVTD